MSWQWTAASLAKLQTFLEAQQLTQGALTTTRIGDGHSNLTFLVSDGHNEVIVRRPPPPPLPKGAHDVLREALIIKGLANTSVAVPKMLATAEAGIVFDVPFYVMSYVQGEVITNTTPTGLASPHNCQHISEAYVDGLVALHRVDWQQQGLAKLGRPEGFNARHLRRISSLIATKDGNLPVAFTPIYQWLSSNTPPESAACLIHNDYRLGNVMFSAQPPATLLAILDWELATIGDPLMDLAYLLNAWPSHEPLTPVQDFATAALDDGYLSTQALLERYQAQTPFDTANVQWYRVFVDWKLAVLYEYSRRRGEDSYYQTAGLVERFLQSSQQLINSDGI